MKAPPMGTRADAVRRLARVRRELDEAAEWVTRLTAEIENMPMPKPTDIKLVGSAEAIEIAGIAGNTFHVLRRRGQTPEPLAELASGPVWLRETIEQWVEARGAR